MLIHIDYDCSYFISLYYHNLNFRMIALIRFLYFLGFQSFKSPLTSETFYECEPIDSIEDLNMRNLQNSNLAEQITLSQMIDKRMQSFEMDRQRKLRLELFWESNELYIPKWRRGKLLIEREILQKMSTRHER